MAPTVVVGSNGVFVAGVHRHDVGAAVRRVREQLDAAGLRAMPAVPVISADIDAVQAHADSDRRFGPSTLRRARAALGVSAPFPFVATIAEPAPAPVPAAELART